MRVIEVDLLNIDKAIAEVEAYKREIKDKCETAKKLIAQKLEHRVRAGFAQAVVDDNRVPEVGVYVNDNGDILTVVAEGQDAVFVEFGAGVHYNTSPGTSPHPKGAELGFTIGSYGLGYGSLDSWQYRRDGEIIATHGTPASMPMFRAFESVLNDIPNILKEVFA